MAPNRKSNSWHTTLSCNDIHDFSLGEWVYTCHNAVMTGSQLSIGCSLTTLPPPHHQARLQLCSQATKPRPHHSPVFSCLTQSYSNFLRGHSTNQYLHHRRIVRGVLPPVQLVQEPVLIQWRNTTYMFNKHGSMNPKLAVRLGFTALHVQGIKDNCG